MLLTGTFAAEESAASLYCFECTKEDQVFVVPKGAKKMKIAVWGAAGGIRGIWRKWKE